MDDGRGGIRSEGGTGVLTEEGNTGGESGRNVSGAVLTECVAGGA